VLFKKDDVENNKKGHRISIQWPFVFKRFRFFGFEERRSYMNFSRMPPYCTKNGTKTSDRMADSFIRIFSDGPDVSFRGSPTGSL
jgi:hypothetical protein